VAADTVALEKVEKLMKLSEKIEAPMTFLWDMAFLKSMADEARALEARAENAEADAEFKVGEVEIDRDCLRDENTRLNERLKVAEAAIARVRALEGAVFTQSAQVSAANWNGWLDARLVREALDGPLNSKGDKT
jgi:hypothetical protein